jgi:hypothetical protein
MSLETLHRTQDVGLVDRSHLASVVVFDLVLLERQLLVIVHFPCSIKGS